MSNFNSNINNHSETNHESQHLSEIITPDKEQDDSQNLVETVEDKLIAAAVQLPKKEWIENISVAEIPDKENEIEQDEVPVTMDPVLTENVSTVGEDIEPSISVKTKMHPTYFISDLKVANYKDYRSGTLYENEINNSLSAQYENVDSKDSQTSSTHKVLYTAHLEKCMNNFKKGKMKKAIKGYRIILKHYPDDANALFYGGLAYYNIGLTEKSIALLNKSAIHEYKVFNEESEWYLALAHLKSGESKKAISLLNKIANSESFYASRAESELAKHTAH